MSQEPTQRGRAFGDNDFGQSCLLACRLVASGVRFVTVNSGGWDMHQDNFPNLKDKALPELGRRRLSALLTTLIRSAAAGIDVVIRHRRIRPHAQDQQLAAAATTGRGPCSCLMAGGGMRGGQVIGASDDKGMGPAGEAITPDKWPPRSTTRLGIDYHKEYHTNTGRPVMIVRKAT